MTDVERVLARALTEIVVSLDLSDDDEIDPDVATGILEPVAALLQNAPAEDRQAIVRLFTECAEEETEASRRLTALDLPDAFGIR
ncbi:hypothetical protein ABZ297_15965 [Nonomuraea sp. NPDC005983]|uniref:hypothetical protein n=1 Tax=Nonomuraea sp. NPDC005983 TaxID=3155595 RepID=UPI00339E0455